MVFWPQRHFLVSNRNELLEREKCPWEVGPLSFPLYSLQKAEEETAPYVPINPGDERRPLSSDGNSEDHKDCNPE